LGALPDIGGIAGHLRKKLKTMMLSSGQWTHCHRVAGSFLADISAAGEKYDGRHLKAGALPADPQ